MDEATMQAGLLMESIQTQGRQVEAAIERLNVLAHGLDAIVRQEIRAAFVDEFQALGTASAQASRVLANVRRIASLRMLWFSLLASAVSCAVPLAITLWLLPSARELQQLRGEREALSTAILRLRQQGGRIDLRRCGPGERLCVRIDPQAPAYGAQADYRVVLGY